MGDVMKHCAAVLLCALSSSAFTGNALAQTQDQSRTPPYTIALVATLKPVGQPEIATGRVKNGQVFYTRKLTYIRTGVLSAPLSLRGKHGDISLSTGTPVFGFPQNGETAWCTFWKKDTPQTCVMRAFGMQTWAQQEQDVAFLGVARVMLEPGQQPDPAPQAQVDESLPLPDADIRVEFSLGVPDGMNDPVPLTNGQGYIMQSGPKPIMAVGFRYIEAGEPKRWGYKNYPQSGDVLIDGAKLTYDPGKKKFTAGPS